MNAPASLKLLIADDELGMRLGVRRALGKTAVSLPEMNGELGLEILEAEDGHRALQLIRDEAPDLVLLDHSMPGLTGMEILEELAGDEGDRLVIMVTAYASLEMAVRATKQGAYDFLAKPFTPTELKSVVTKAARHLVLGREARRLAAEKRQLRFQFLSVLAHELKAPLSAVEGYLQLLSDGTAEDPETVQHMVDRSLLRLVGMRKLIFDLLDLTRIESGQKSRELAGISLDEVAEMAMETLEPDARARQIEMSLECRGDLRLTSDRGEMEIICNNLVSNAVKYNRDGGRVRVLIDGENASTLRLSVSDTGIGIGEQDQAKLFGEFSRIKNEKTRNILGSGLGLSIVRRLARLNGGDVSLESVEGEGSTFTVLLSRSGVADGNTEQDQAPGLQE